MRALASAGTPITHLPLSFVIDLARSLQPARLSDVLHCVAHVLREHTGQPHCQPDTLECVDVHVAARITSHLNKAMAAAQRALLGA